jgi:hypothetical protein
MIPIFRQHRDRLELNRLPQGENLNGMSCRALYFKVQSKKLHSVHDLLDARSTLKPLPDKDKIYGPGSVMHNPG